MEITLPTFEEVQENDVVLTVDNFDTSTDETVEVDETIEETETEESTEESSIEVDPLAQATYEALVEKGIFDEDESFDGTFDYIDQRIDQLPTKLLDQAINELPEHSQPVLKYIATAGSNLTLDELRDFMKEFINEQEVPDVTTNDSARSFLEEHLRAQGLRPNAIQAQLDDLEDSDELITEADKLLKQREKKTDTLLSNKQVENEQMIEEQRKFVTSVNTTLSEIGWSKSQQQKVLEIIPKTNDILNQVAKSPKAYVQLMDILTKFNGKEFDLSAIEKRGESRANSSIKDKISKSGFSSGGTKTTGSINTPEVADVIKQGYKPIV